MTPPCYRPWRRWLREVRAPLPATGSWRSRPPQFLVDTSGAIVERCTACGATAAVSRRRGDVVQRTEKLCPAGVDSQRGEQETLQALKRKRIPSNA